MTGYSNASAEFEAEIITCELRSVNHRYLDIQMKIPDELKHYEINLRNIIAENIKRGKIECTIKLNPTKKLEHLELDKQVIIKISQLTKEINRRFPDNMPIDPMQILKWPGVIKDKEINLKKTQIKTKEILISALKKLQGNRSNEGKRISKMLENRLKKISKNISLIRKNLPKIIEQNQKQQLEKIKKFNIEHNSEKLETELVLIAQKLDIDEEIDRIESHIKETYITMNSKSPKGRKLDFIMQELNREANTLASKSQHPLTTKSAIDLKVLIEQLREQVQNIE